MLKLVLISPSGTLVDENHKLKSKLVSELCNLISNLDKVGVKVAIWSNKDWLISNKSDFSEYLTSKSGVQVDFIKAGSGNFPARSRNGSIDPILKKYNIERSEAILVGNGDEDLRAGVNNGLLLLRPSWYKNESEYGFLVKSINELERFCVLFGLRKHPIFWSLKKSGLDIYAMGPYSTRVAEYAGFGTSAVQSAKHDFGLVNFWHMLIVSTLYFSNLIADVDYITTYPSHSGVYRKKAIDESMAVLGKCFNKTFYPDLFIRHTKALKSAGAAKEDKTFINQINTIKINRLPTIYGERVRKSPIPLKGKVILIVDDICTYGRSLETARLFIEAAGGKAILFSWLKTINSEYKEVTTAPVIAPYKDNDLIDEPKSKDHYYGSGIVDYQAADEISSLMEKYKSWAV